jgi:hypothetical protein
LRGSRRIQLFVSVSETTSTAECVSAAVPFPQKARHFRSGRGSITRPNGTTKRKQNLPDVRKGRKGTAIGYGDDDVWRQGRRKWSQGRDGRPYLDDVVLEADALLLLAGAVLDVEDADDVRGPAAQDAVEDLQQHAGQHPQLGEGVGQRQKHLRHLQG